MAPASSCDGTGEYYDGEAFVREPSTHLNPSTGGRDDGRPVQSVCSRAAERGCGDRDREGDADDDDDDDDDGEGGETATVWADALSPPRAAYPPAIDWGDVPSTPNVVFTARGNWGESNGWDPSCMVDLDDARALSSVDAHARVGGSDDGAEKEAEFSLLCSVKNNPCAPLAQTTLCCCTQTYIPACMYPPTSYRIHVLCTRALHEPCVSARTHASLTVESAGPPDHGHHGTQPRGMRAQVHQARSALRLYAGLLRRRHRGD